MAYGDVLWYNKFDGWTTVDDDALLAILRNTQDTPYGISGITQQYIAPEWVLDALKTYNDNGGFAGLSPAEYLDKVSCGKTSGPKHTF